MRLMRWPCCSIGAVSVSFFCLLFLSPSLNAKVSIDGVQGEVKDNVLAWVALGKLPEDAPREAIHRRYRSANKEIRSALQALGYYSPSIAKSLQIDAGKSWLASFKITPGPRSTIEHIEIDFSGEGAQDLGQAFKAPDWIGRELHHDDYRKLKSELLSRAANLGYLQAQFSRSILRVDPKVSTAAILLSLDSGPRFQFGAINIEQDILAVDFIHRYVDIQAGQAFSADALLNLQLRLSDLDYFQNLDVNTDTDEEQRSVAVTFATLPKKPQRYQIGLGYGTDTGPRLSLASDFRYLNQHGHRLHSDVRLAETQETWSAQYLIPTGREVGSQWGLSVAFSAEKFADARSDSWLWRLGRSQVDGARLWQGYLSYELEKFRVGDKTQEQTELLMPGLSLSLRETDDDLNPTRGYKFFVDIHGAHKSVVSSDSFVQMLLQARFILPLPAQSRLLLRGQYGHNFVGAISELPLAQRFFAGGDQSVRGYAYQSLGPRDDEGDIIGGQYLSIASAEFSKIFWRDYGAAVFIDYGGASDDLFQDLFAGAGLGLRWRSGIGMLRADFAWPLNNDEASMRVHIGIGAEL